MFKTLRFLKGIGTALDVGRYVLREWRRYKQYREWRRYKDSIPPLPTVPPPPLDILEESRSEYGRKDEEDTPPE